MSMDDEYHAHTRREELLYVHAYDEVEKTVPTVFIGFSGREEGKSG